MCGGGFKVDDVGFLLLADFFFFVDAVFFPLVLEDFVEAPLVFAFHNWGQLGDGGEGSVEFVLDGFFDGFCWVGGGFAVDWREVDAGDLEAVEEEAGAAGVELVGGDALEDLGDGELDGGAVFDEGEVEGFAFGGGGFAFAGVPNRDAGGVVEVAKLFVAEAGGAAAKAVGLDVAALEACGLDNF